MPTDAPKNGKHPAFTSETFKEAPEEPPNEQPAEQPAEQPSPNDIVIDGPYMVLCTYSFPGSKTEMHRTHVLPTHTVFNMLRPLDGDRAGGTAICGGPDLTLCVLHSIDQIIAARRLALLNGMIEAGRINMQAQGVVLQAMEQRRREAGKLVTPPKRIFRP